MVGGKHFGLLCVIKSLILKLSRDLCPCQSNMGGLYQVGTLSLFAGSMKQLDAAWTTNMLQFGKIALVPWSWGLLLPPPPPPPPLPPLLQPPPPPPLLFPLAMATRRAEFCFVMRSTCLHWASSSMHSRSAGCGFSRVGARSFATYSRAAASDFSRLSI